MTINWIQKHVPGIIEAWFPGAQGGTAIADVLLAITTRRKADGHVSKDGGPDSL
jgi:hypothetical protein